MELVHHVQWKRPSHASYFTRKNDTHRSTTAPVPISGAPNAPLSAEHLLAQIMLVDRANRGDEIEFVLKCHRNVHLVPVFKTSGSMVAKKEVYVSRQGKSQRLDTAFYENDTIVFNAEIKYQSRTSEGRRDGLWVEVNAMHALDVLDKEAPPYRIVCEPRGDMSMRCHFMESSCCFECRQCVEETAGACIVNTCRSMLMARRIRAKQRETAGACIVNTCRRLLMARKIRAKQRRLSEKEKARQGRKIAGIDSKATLRRGLTESQLRREQKNAALMFRR